MPCSKLPIFALALVLAAAARAQLFLPPGVLNPGADSDGGDDVFVTHLIGPDLTTHAVWVSQVDHTGSSGTDPDLFYRRLPPGGVWSPPELVNTYGSLDGGADERHPRLALDSAGVLHCVWQSQHGYAGAGSDWDVFYARRTATGWQNAEAVNAAGADHATLPSDDVHPALAILGNGDVVVTWETNRALTPAPSDRDLAFRVRDSGVWGPIGAVHGNALFDSGDDLGPAAMATLSGGDVVAVWSTDDDFRLGAFSVGPDRDVVWSRLGEASGWSEMLEASALARSDSGDDRNPAVAVWGSGLDEELHVVWQSTEDHDFAGADWDIFYSVTSVNLLVLPVPNPTFLVNRRAPNDGSAPDERPSICAEPGGTLHVVWQSRADPLATLGSDYDVLHAVNGTPGLEWSLDGLLGLNAYFDGAAEEDLEPDVRCAGDGILSGMWASRDDLGGPVGADFDVFHAIGFGLGVSRPAPVNPWGSFDGITVDDRDVAFAVDSQDRLHAVWSSRQSGNGAPVTGFDLDVLYAVRGPSGWSAVELVNQSGFADVGHDFDPDVAVDAGGTVHVAWSSHEDIGGVVGNDGDIFYAVRPSGGPFTAPQRVHESARTDTLFPNDDVEPRIAVSPLGTVHVAWVSGESVAPPLQGQISYASNSGAGWSATEVASAGAAGGYHLRPDLALVGESPVLVWESTSTLGGTVGSDRDVLFAQRGAAGWPVPTALGNAALDAADDFLPALAVTPSGEVHAVWSTTDAPAVGGDADLVHAARNGSTWSPAKLLLTQGASDSGHDGSPRLATDGTALHVLWDSSDGLALGFAGSDFDVFYARIPLPATLPSSVPVGVADASAFGDFTREFAQALALDGGGRPWFGWLREGAFEAQFGPDQDVLYARPVNPSSKAGLIFEDGFETGDTSAWPVP